MLSASLLPGKPLLLLIETAISRSLSITETISLCSPFIPLLSVAVSQHSRCCISTASHPLSFPLLVEGKAALPLVRTQHCCCRGAALLFVPNAGTAALLPPSAGLSSLHVIPDESHRRLSLFFSKSSATKQPQFTLFFLLHLSIDLAAAFPLFSPKFQRCLSRTPVIIVVKLWRHPRLSLGCHRSSSRCPIAALRLPLRQLYLSLPLFSLPPCYCPIVV